MKGFVVFPARSPYANANIKTVWPKASLSIWFVNKVYTKPFVYTLLRAWTRHADSRPTPVFRTESGTVKGE
jgi:hypothetical protein